MFISSHILESEMHQAFPSIYSTLVLRECEQRKPMMVSAKPLNLLLVVISIGSSPFDILEHAIMPVLNASSSQKGHR